MAGEDAYLGGATFDLLPSGPTGTYWANGISLASTLEGPAEDAQSAAYRSAVDLEVDDGEGDPWWVIT